MRPPGAIWRLRPEQQRLDVQHAVAEPIADHRVPGPGCGSIDARRRRRGDVADLEADVGVARPRALDRVRQVVDAHAAGLGQRRQQVAFAAADLEHRRVRRDRCGLNASFRSWCRKSRAPRGRRRVARAREEVTPGRLQHLRPRRRGRQRADVRVRRCFGFVLTGSPDGESCSVLGGQRVPLLEVLARLTLMLSVWSICMSARLNASLCLPQGSL